MAAQRRNKQKPGVVSGPVEIPDAEHELVIERVAAIDVAKAAGKVCVRLPGKSGRRFSRGVGRARTHRRHHRTRRAAQRVGYREGHRRVHLGLRAT